ncbi:MAG TPA: hypothetical protein VGH73_09265 [Thermoanaerobaculia bacterium]|jgi:CHASE3 domain sensor protein
MPKVALAESLADWESLIVNASVHAADDPELSQHLEELRSILKRAQETEALRLRLNADRQVATRTLGDAKAQGKRLTSRIRSKLKAIHGLDSERLASFGMRPRRSR